MASEIVNVFILSHFAHADRTRQVHGIIVLVRTVLHNNALDRHRSNDSFRFVSLSSLFPLSLSIDLYRLQSKSQTPTQLRNKGFEKDFGVRTEKIIDIVNCRKEGRINHVIPHLCNERVSTLRPLRYSLCSAAFEG